MTRPELSLVIPIYNEEEVLPQLDVRLKELLARLAIDTEVVFVNDGSKDKSIELLRRMASHELRYRVIGFSRNFGHQRAITAGVDKSRGRAVVVMDADLQDPPEVILEMVAKWQEGFDVVYGRRRSRQGESWFKLITAKLFYRLFAAMIPIEVPLDTGDFRLMSRRVVLTMRGLRETHRFVRGLVAWVGFRQTAVEYDRAARAAGETKYPLRRMLAFAIDGIASFSIQPLRMATYFGVFVAVASVLLAIAAVVSNYMGHTVPGWTTTVVLLSFLFSAQFVMIGVLGEYVGRIYEQVKRRPLYIISERINFQRRNVEKLSTQDLDEVKTPLALPKPPKAPSSIVPGPALAEPAEVVKSKPPPVPPAAPSPAPIGSKRVISRTPAAPETAGKPKLSSSVANIHVALPIKSSEPPKANPSAPPKATASVPPKVGPSTAPPKPTHQPFASRPPSPPTPSAGKKADEPFKQTPSSLAMKAAAPTKTPSSPHTKAAAPDTTAPSAPPPKTPSIPPPKTPSVPPPKTPSVPPPKTPSVPPTAPQKPATWDPATADAIASSDDKKD